MRGFFTGNFVLTGAMAEYVNAFLREQMNFQANSSSPAIRIINLAAYSEDYSSMLLYYYKMSNARRRI
jgi:hypothetical protein